MKLVIDENISFAEEAFESFGEIILLNGRKIDNKILSDADALIVRSITNVNEKLLKNTNVKFVGTATIGTDHIDLDYLSENKIEFSSAAGCNSYAVTEYVFCAIANIITQNHILKENPSIGIFGFGNIGTKISRYAKAMGLDVFISDPPLERAGNPQVFHSPEKVLESDIITFHVPLNTEGIDKTVHLLDENKLEKIKPGTIIINSSRGPVIDNAALLRRLKKNKDIFAVLDVWENEPDFMLELLQNINLGTPHIAGYSLEGKVNGTKMIYDALCKFLSREPVWQPVLPNVDNSVVELKNEQNNFEILSSIFENVYSIKEDDLLLRNSLNMSDNQKKEYFDILRKNYKYRRELNNYKIKIDSGQPENLNLTGLNWISEFRLNLVS
ncbi:MAG: 4-phosphoerythronate dehydrogenase [Bacteroidetes bacterium]|nr:4-phosphoerythronate dehydrogenase [Bacteroidota bacterium]